MQFAIQEQVTMLREGEFALLVRSPITLTVSHAMPLTASPALWASLEIPA